jgi:hypothetical protein
MTVSVQRRLSEFLVRHGGQRFCIDCLGRAVADRNVMRVRRAVAMLSADPGYRAEEDADCTQCGNTKRTVRALWVGL